MNQRSKSNLLTLFVGGSVIVATGVFIVHSRLIFDPVPWPDGSAFYLPSLDLFSWPPRWRMHNQAAFVPSYDTANFNLMPGLPILFGLFEKFGFMHWVGPTLATKLLSISALFLWAWILWRWLDSKLVEKIGKSSSLLIASIVALAGLWDPVIRWGTWVVRTETWIGLCWILILRELWKIADPSTHLPFDRNKSYWKIAAVLALAAYFHFEAIILVPAVSLGIAPFQRSNQPFLKGWWKSLITVGTRTALFLLPWIAYVLLHFSSFIEQMQTQFFRLAGKNSWIATPHLLFHSLFLDHGSPSGTPKFFNIAKLIFWILILFLTSNLIRGLFLRLRKKENDPSLAPILGAGTAFWYSFYLWCTKAEVWFITLCHLMLWSWMAVYLLSNVYRRNPGNLLKWIPASAAIYGLLAAVGSVVQSQKIQSSYNWNTYQNWIECIDSTIKAQKTNQKLIKIWQPHVPDALVELSSRHPQYDLTRTLDFEAEIERARSFVQKVDVLLLTLFFDIPPGHTIPNYQGPFRAEDESTQRKVPFGDEGLHLIHSSQLNPDSPLKWHSTVCQQGPFWASVIILKK